MVVVENCRVDLGGGLRNGVDFYVGDFQKRVDCADYGLLDQVQYFGGRVVGNFFGGRLVNVIEVLGESLFYEVHVERVDLIDNALNLRNGKVLINGELSLESGRVAVELERLDLEKLVKVFLSTAVVLFELVEESGELIKHLVFYVLDHSLNSIDDHREIKSYFCLFNRFRTFTLFI